LFFLIFPKFLLFLIFIKFFYNCFDTFNNFFSKFLSFSFLFSILFSVLFAIYQDKIKKILIFNSLFSTGFQLLFISLSILESIQGFFFYLFFYLITLFTFFLLKISLFEYNISQVSFNFNILNKLYYSNFFLSFLLIILIFNSLGIPPFANFFCKIFIFYSCIITKDYTDFLFLLFFSMISSFYHLRFLKSIFFDLCLGKIFFISPIP
jgi:NADH-quinone oxidoreductase subunit N